MGRGEIAKRVARSRAHYVAILKHAVRWREINMKGDVLNWRICDTPIAVVDIETTGLNPSSDRVIEISVIRQEYGKEPELVINTLLNPKRKVTARHIHRVTDQDVADAPTFEEVAECLVDALADCVVAAYNAYFDVGFINTELSRLQGPSIGPYICLMYTGKLVGLFERCSLHKACDACGLKYQGGHEAVNDAFAALELWNRYCELFPSLSIETFHDLRRLGSYRFLDSFQQPPLVGNRTHKPRPAFKPRFEYGILGERANLDDVEIHTAAYREYWEAIKTILSDLRVSAKEIRALQNLQSELRIADEQVRSIHARAFANAIANCIDDDWVDDQEWARLHDLYGFLKSLGWAPGDKPSPRSLSAVPIDSQDLTVDGRRIVLTGVFDSYSRAALTDLLRSMGALVTTSVSKKTDLVIAGKNAGTKLDKARELRIEIWDESQLLEGIKGKMK